jgi:hypothetical protein
MLWGGCGYFGAGAVADRMLVQLPACCWRPSLPKTCCESLTVLKSITNVRSDIELLAHGG